MSPALAFAWAHAVILLTWIIACAALTGNGALLLTALGGGLRSWRDVSSAFWLGIAAAIGVLQLWHFVAPVGAPVVFFLCLLGGAGWWAVRRDAVRLAVSTPALPRVVTVGSLVLLVWIANRALAPVTLYDTGMYHQAVVNWSTAYPIVPGLGNLHGRLAFNSSSLLFASMFDVGRLHGMAAHTANSLLFAVLAVEGVLSWGAARTSVNPRAFQLFSIAIIPAVIHAAIRDDVHSLSTDAAVCALLFAATRLAFDALAHREHDSRARGTCAAAIVTLFAAVVSIKLSGIVFGVLGALVAATLWRSGGDTDEAPAAKRVVWWLAPTALLAVAWLSRGVVLSGYPMYPSTALAAPVDWRVPVEQAQGEAAWIVMSARNFNSSMVYTGNTWVIPWVRHAITRSEPFVQFVVPLMVCGLAGVWAVLRRRQRREVLWTREWRLIWVPLAGAALFWVSTAPHTRMAEPITWGAAAVAAAWWSSAFATRRSPATTLATVVVCFTIAIVAKEAVTASLDNRALGAGARALFTFPEDAASIAPLPPMATDSFTTAHGVGLVVPRKDNRCNDAPLLCTPHPTSHLAYRDAPHLGKGFRTEGGRWAPRRWPNPWSPFLAYWRCSRDGTDTRSARESRCLRAARESLGRQPNADREPAPPAGP